MKKRHLLLISLLCLALTACNVSNEEKNNSTSVASTYAVTVQTEAVSEDEVVEETDDENPESEAADEDLHIIAESKDVGIDSDFFENTEDNDQQSAESVVQSDLATSLADCLNQDSGDSATLDNKKEGTWSDGVRNGQIQYIGYMQVLHFNSDGSDFIRYSNDIYFASCNSGYAQAVTDQENAMIYAPCEGQSNWGTQLGDHVKSTASGKSVINDYNYPTLRTLYRTGTYEMYNWTVGDKLQIVYVTDDGYIIKNWYLESIDKNAYYKNSHVFFANGSNADNWNAKPENADNSIILTHCWPNAWGSYPKTGCDGRVISVFREDHAKAWDVWRHADGTITYGDYDIRTNTFTAK